MIVVIPSLKKLLFWGDIMQKIISEILEMCGNDKKYVREVANALLDLCDRTYEDFEENELLGYCECCGIPIYRYNIYEKLDGVYYCDYCGGEYGIAISEMEEEL